MSVAHRIALDFVVCLAGTGLGHALGAYRNAAIDGPHDHWLLAAVNFSGLPFVAFSFIDPSSSWFSIPASFAVPLVLWLIARRKNIAALTRESDARSCGSHEGAG